MAATTRLRESQALDMPAADLLGEALSEQSENALVGAIVATLVLLPEGAAAVQAARRNRLQTSLNLALGSGLASISLTIPAVAAVSLYLGKPLVLGLGSKEIVLLA